MDPYRDDPAAHAAACELTDMLTSVLTPTERRVFMAEAFRVAKALIDACRQQAAREMIRYEPSVN